MNDDEKQKSASAPKQQPCREHPYHRPYASPTEDIAMAHVMRDRHREQRKAREHRAYLKRKAAWEARHPGKGYGNRKRFNTSVWRSEDWE